MSNQKTHVLQVVGKMNTGGAEVMLMDVFRNISPKTKFSFLVNYKKNIGVEKGDFDQEIENNGAIIKHIPTQWDLGPIKYIKEFTRIYNNLGKPEVVHIHLNAKCGIIALAAKRAGAKKIIAHSHADLKFRGSFLSRNFGKLELFFQKILISRYATDFWGASNEANLSLYYKSNNKTVVINNAVDTEKFQNVSLEQVNNFKKEFNIPDTKLVFTNVGRIVRHKNVDFIIEVLSEYKKEESNFIFLFAGRIDDKAYFEEINKKIKDHNLEDNVLHIGNRGDIPVVINASDVFIAPALKEGFGLVAAEAQVAGVPCLLYKGFPKAVDMGLNLVAFFNDFNVKQWTEVLLKTKKSNSISKQDIKDSIANKGFDIKRNTLEIEKLYKDER